MNQTITTAEDPPTSRSRRRLRAGLSRFTTGVTVVTFHGPDGPRGFTVNSFTSVSLNPPLILVGVARGARAHSDLPGRHFAVNVLGAEQVSLAKHFAGHDGAAPSWLESGEAPTLAGSLATFQCRPWHRCAAGDHTLHLGIVTAFDYRSGDLLGFVNGRFATVTEPVDGIEYLL